MNSSFVSKLVTLSTPKTLLVGALLVCVFSFLVYGFMGVGQDGFTNNVRAAADEATDGQLSWFETTVESFTELLTDTERVQSAAELDWFVDDGRLTPLLRPDDTTDAPTQTVYGATFNTDVIFEEWATGLEAFLPAGLTITTENQAVFDVTALGIEVLDTDEVAEASSDSTPLKFGVSGQSLHFSEPVKVTVPTDQPDGASVTITVRHGGQDTFETTGITMNPDATCDADGLSSDEHNMATADNGLVTFYTCGASTFILDPDGDGTNEIRIWLKADGAVYDDTAGTDPAVNGDTVGVWQNELGDSNNGTAPTTGQQPEFVENAFNFNPGVSFDRANSEELEFTKGFYNRTFFAVMKSNEAITQSTTPHRTAIGFQGYPSFDNTVAVAFGGFTDDISNEIIGYRGPRYSVGYVPSGAVDLQIPFITSYRLHFVDNLHAKLLFRYNGLDVGTETANTVLGAGDTPFHLGANLDGGNHADVTIAEFISHLNISEFGLTEVQQINSYLALKYGITLDPSAGNYLDDSANSVYNTSSHANDVIGLGRDNDTTLDQRVSTSVNSGSVLTIATDNDFTSANGGLRTQLTDGQYLVVGHDGGAITTQTTELSTDMTERITREWRVENTGSVGAVNLKFDGFNDEWSLYTDADGDFSAGASKLGNLSSGGEISGVTLNDGSYFTLSKSMAAPGGVLSGLSVWLKADGAVYDDAGATDPAVDGDSVEVWQNQIEDGNDGTPAGVTRQPDFVANAINFNPGVAFNNSTDDKLQYTNGFYTEQYFAVLKADEALTSASTYQAPIGFVGNDNTGTAVGLGNITGSINNEVVGYRAGNIGYRSAYDDDTVDVQTPFLTTVREKSTSNGLDFRFNGEDVTTEAGASYIRYSNRLFHLGGTPQGVSHANATIGEFVVYADPLTDTQEQRVNSYLAAKYGITLDQTVATNYLDSSGSSVWTASTNTGYDNDIAGLIQDDIQGLDQRIAKSINDTSIVTMATTSNFSSQNSDVSRTSLGDNNSIFWGNNGTTPGAWSATGAPSGFIRIATEWKVEEAGAVGALHMQVDVDDLERDLPDFSGDLYLVHHATDLSLATPVAMTDQGGGLWTVSGVNFADGDLFSFMASDSVDIEFSDSTAASTGEATADNFPSLFLNGTVNTATSINVAVSGGTATGSGTDYTYTTQTVSIPVGVYDGTSATAISLTPPTLINDSEVESGGETIIFDLTSAGSGVLIADADGDTVIEVPHTYTITDNTNIELETATASDTETAGGNLPNLILSGTLTADTAIDLTLNDSGSATVGTDYTFAGQTSLPQTITVTVPAGVYSPAAPLALSSLNLSSGGSIGFAITQDSISETDETISVSLSNPQNGLVIGDVAGGSVITDHTYTISDDDSAGVALSRSNTSVVEGDGIQTYTIVLLTDIDSDVIIDLSDSSGELSGLTTSITFTPAGGANPWNTPQTISFTPVDDTDVDGTEVATITHTVTTTATGYVGIAVSDHVVTIADNEKLGVTVEQADSQVDPTNIDSVDYTVTFSQAIDPTTFSSADISLTGTASGSVLPGSLTTTDNVVWSFSVTGLTDGDTVAASIAADVVLSAGGSSNSNSTSTDNAVTYDITPPSTPTSALDLDASSDSGGDDTDNLTNDTTPTLSVSCGEIGATITVYTDNPADNTVVGTHTCASTGTEQLTLTSDLASGEHNLTYTVTDAAGNTSPISTTSLTITIDTDPPPIPTVSLPVTAGSPWLYPDVTLTVDCAAVGNVITIYGPGITPDPTTHTCSSVGPEDVVITVTDGGSLTVTVSQTDDLGNESEPTAVSFITGTANDNDGDGVPNAEENSGINNNDVNNDGIPDAEQSNVVSMMNPVTGDYVVIIADTTACQQAAMSNVSIEATDDTDDHSYPTGLASFTLSCSNVGATVTMTKYHFGDYNSDDLSLHKYDATSDTYASIDGARLATVTIGGRTALEVAYEITDGGVLDEDGIANGVIIDPVGVAQPVSSDTVGAPNTGLLQQQPRALLYLAIIAGVSLLLAYGVRVKRPSR